METKKDLRKKAKEIRKNLDIKTISKIIVEKIENHKFFKNSNNIMLFYPLENEIDLLNLIENHPEKNFYLPRTLNAEMEACPYKFGDKLIKDDFNVCVPRTHGVNPEILDLIFVPALMVDKNNYRLGYGKGFYDRFLTKTNAKTIVPISKNLIVETLPIEFHDQKVDFIITE